MAAYSLLALLSLASVLCGICQQTAARSLSEYEDDDSDWYYDKYLDAIVTEYDIAIPVDEWDESITEEPNRLKRTAGWKDKNKRWPDKVVNFELVETDMTAHELNTIRLSLKEWAHYTCVKFEESAIAENRLVIMTGNRCISFVGMRGGSQALVLGPTCRYKEIIVHEVGHALGLQHEQNRPDRDEYVTVKTENIKELALKNFKKRTWDEILDLGIPYDYYSLMHYTKDAFTKNNRTTIETKDPKYQDVIGEQTDLSFGDIMTVNLMYDCGKETPSCTLKDADCPNGGFVGKDCTCWCPGSPVQYCDEKDKKEKGDLLFPECSDRYAFCPKWGSTGYCTNHMADFTKEHCKFSCKHC